jgi:hypothetical protein
MQILWPFSDVFFRRKWFRCFIIMLYVYCFGIFIYNFIINRSEGDTWSGEGERRRGKAEEKPGGPWSTSSRQVCDLIVLWHYGIYGAAAKTLSLFASCSISLLLPRGTRLCTLGSILCYEIWNWEGNYKWQWTRVVLSGKWLLQSEHPGLDYWQDLGLSLCHHIQIVCEVHPVWREDTALET